MRAALAAAAGMLGLALASCALEAGQRGAPPQVGSSADPAAGRRLIVERGCGTCHRIPGVAGADAHVAAPLDRWAQRSFIAGSLPNSEANLVRWLADPQALEPGTAMPDLGLSPDEARDIAAYLFTLR